MDNELRALIVARLRAEADRIEAGGVVIDAYYDALGETDSLVDPDTARAAACDAIIDALDGREWNPAVDDIEWGVRVTVERASIVAIGRSDEYDYRADYELRTDGLSCVASVMVTRCPECDHEEAVPPGGTCSDCGCVDKGSMPYGVTL